MSDLLTRLAQRALGVAAPAVEPRLPARYAGPSAADDEPAFVEESAEVDAAPAAFAPRRSAAPPRAADPPVAHVPAPPLAPSAAGERERAADGSRRIHPPAVPPVPGAKAGRATEDARPALHPPPRAAHPLDPAPSPPPREGEGPREVDAFLEAEDASAPLFPLARARKPDARRVDAGADDPHPPRAAAPAEDGSGLRRVVKVVDGDSGESGERARPRDADAAGEKGDLSEGVDVVEREADRRTRAELSPAEADAPRRTAAAPARAAERGPLAERADGRVAEEPARPVVRVTIGRIEVRAAPAAPAPQPAPRPGWSPPVMPLADYLKREAGR